MAVVSISCGHRVGDLINHKEFPMSPLSLRKTALVAGVLYLLTFVSIPTLFLYVPVHDPNYILGPGPDTGVFVGGIAEVIVALAGVACLLSIVSLRQAGAGTGALAIGQTLAILYDRIFLLSQSLMPAVNDLLLGVLLYRSGLVPRVLPLIAFIGAPLLLASDAAKLFDLLGPTAPLAALAALPVALFEFSLGVYLVVKGFKPAPILASDPRDAGVNRSLAPAAAAR
jgi:hypothetical protein